MTATKHSPRTIAGSILIFFPGLALIVSGVLKIAGVPPVVNQMAALGFSGGKLVLIAVLEILSGSLFLYPRTRSIGMLLVSAFLGGAICAHVQAGEYPKAFSPALLLSLSWIGVWLLHPQTLWSLNNPAPDAAPARSFASHEI